MITLALPGLDATRRLAVTFASVLEPADVVLLEGSVGAGKTTFVALLGSELGVLEPVRSPTFTVAHRYELADGRTLAHLDLYRDRGTLDQQAWADLEPYFEDATFVCIEWPATGLPWFGDRIRWRLGLEIVDEHTRLARIQGADPVRQAAAVDAIAATFVP